MPQPVPNPHFLETTLFSFRRPQRTARAWPGRLRSASVALVAVSLVVAGCQSIIAVDVIRSPLTPVADKRNPELVLEQTQKVILDTGYERTLERGTHWKLFGSIVEGKVYQPIDGDFTIQGRDPVSAYLVVSNGQLIGFYVPIEEGFSPLDKKISISFAQAKPSKAVRDD